MRGALPYLAWRSTVNRVAARLRRLREPRYLIGLVVAMAYFYFVLFRNRGGSRAGREGLLAAASQYQDLLVVAGALALLFFVVLAWLWPGRRRPALHFTQADVQFLFPAPFTRRDLIRYKLLRSQIGVLIGSAVMTVLFRPGSAAAGWMFFGGMALVMMALNVHLVGVSLVRHAHREAGGSRLVWRHRWPQALVLGAVVALAATYALAWERLLTLGDVRAIAEEAARLASTGAAGALLWPFRAAARLPLAATAGQWLAALPAVLVLLAVNYVWVVRSDVAFEETAAEMAERRSTTGAAPAPVSRRRKASASPFQLGLDGRPEVAILWKNLLLIGRYASIGIIVRVAIMLLIMGAILSRAANENGLFATIAVVAFIASGFAVFMGPQLVRNDLRQDLAYLDAIKLWPVSGAAIVRGEVLAPAAILSGFVAFAIAAATVVRTDWFAEMPAWAAGGPVGWATALILVAAGLILAQVVAQNALALLFPAWAAVGAPRTRGIEVMGQRMLMLAGMLVVVAGAALPAGAGAALVGAACWAVMGQVPVVLPALAAVVVLVFESLVAVEALGRLYDRTDPTAVDPAGG